MKCISLDFLTKFVRMILLMLKYYNFVKKIRDTALGGGTYLILPFKSSNVF
jgi:hypothetical protein